VAAPATVACAFADSEKRLETSKGMEEKGKDRSNRPDSKTEIDSETAADRPSALETAKAAGDSAAVAEPRKSALGVELDVGVWQRLQVGVGDPEIVPVGEGLNDRVASGECEIDCDGNGDGD
jgi:hypothetical protein